MRSVLIAILLAAAAFIGPVSAWADLYVSSMNSGAVGRYDESTGAGGILVPFAFEERTALAFGPDGKLYVATGSRVERRDPSTGALLGMLESVPAPFRRVFTALTFGPDASLYASDSFGSQVLRFNAVTGVFLNEFATVPQLSHGSAVTLDGASLLVTTEFLDIRRYSIATRAYEGVFSSHGRVLGQITFGPDANLYATDFFGDRVFRLDGATGATLGTFASGGGMSDPFGLAFGPDGNLYVSSGGDDRIYVYDGATGAPIRSFAPTGLLIDAQTNLAFFAPVPEPKSYLLCAIALAVVAARLRRRGT